MKQLFNGTKKNVSDSSHCNEVPSSLRSHSTFSKLRDDMHQTEPNRTAPQIPVFPLIFIPINSPDCLKPHSNSNLQPPRDPQVTHKTTLMNCLQSGDGQLSSLCYECEDHAGQMALSSFPTLPFMGFWGRLGWVAPSTSCRLWESRKGSHTLSQFTSGPPLAQWGGQL